MLLLPHFTNNEHKIRWNIIMREMLWSVLSESENKKNEYFICFLDLELSRADIEKAVLEAKATVDSSYVYSRRAWVYKPAELLNKSSSDSCTIILLNLTSLHITGTLTAWREMSQILQTSSGCWSSLLDKRVMLCALLTTWSMPWNWSSAPWKHGINAPSMKLVCGLYGLPESSIKILINQ